MFWRVATNELRQQFRQGVLTLLGLLLLFLLGITLAARFATFSSNEAANREATHRVREQWISQGPKHPHSGAHFGTYVFRQSFPVEVLEPGITSFSGQIFPLVTHQRDFPIGMPIENKTSFTRYGELSPGVIGLALLSLFAVLSGYGVVAIERQDGTLRLLLAAGVSPATILLGKLSGLACAIGILWFVKCLLEAMVVGSLATSPGVSTADMWLRFAGYQGVHLAYLMVWVTMIVSISAWIKQPRVALAVLLSFWIGNTILLPRIASTTVRLFLPEPSTEEFSGAIKHDISFRPDGTEWVNGWSKQLITDTLRHYGVQRIEDLPVGYAGIMLKSSDAHYEEIFAIHFERLHKLHERQQRWHHALSFLGPWVAARSLLEGFAGSDLAHSARFAEAAERYRRSFVESTNDVAERRGKGSGWEVEVEREYWQSVPDFHYDPPTATWAFAQHFVSIGVLSTWLFAVLVGFYFSRFHLQDGT